MTGERLTKGKRALTKHFCSSSCSCQCHHNEPPDSRADIFTMEMKTPPPCTKTRVHLDSGYVGSPLPANLSMAEDSDDEPCHSTPHTTPYSTPSTTPHWRDRKRDDSGIFSFSDPLYMNYTIAEDTEGSDYDDDVFINEIPDDDFINEGIPDHEVYPELLVPLNQCQTMEDTRGVGGACGERPRLQVNRDNSGTFTPTSEERIRDYADSDTDYLMPIIRTGYLDNIIPEIIARRLVRQSIELDRYFREQEQQCPLLPSTETLLSGLSIVLLAGTIFYYTRS